MTKQYKSVDDMTPEEVDEFLRDQGVIYPSQPKLSMPGEFGPELVSFGGGERVYPTEAEGTHTQQGIPSS